MGYNVNACLFILTVLLNLSISSATNQNYNNLMRKYILMCGPHYLCNKSLDFTHVPKQNYSNLNLCPECSCEHSCILFEKCCPDVFFKLPGQSYEDTVILDSTVYGFREQVPMVRSCPNTSSKRNSAMCLRELKPTERMGVLPVTSLTTALTYINYDCALCHGDRNTFSWMLNISCYLFSDFNYLSSFQEVIDQARTKECIIKYDTNKSLVRTTPQDETMLYMTCNVTGLWETYDADIYNACASTYVSKYKWFKNVFCYMCNPSYHSNNDVINACNTTGLWRHYDKNIEIACAMLEEVESRRPFKNIFCYLCNRDDSDNDLFQDVSAEVFEYYQGKEYGVMLFDYEIDVLHFKLRYHRLLTTTNMTMDPDLMSKTKLINLTNVLMHVYARNPISPGLCDRSAIPPHILTLLEPWWENCSCVWDESIPLCMDIILTKLFSCSSNVLNFGFSGTTMEYFTRHVGDCSINVNDVSLQRCRGKPTDIFNLLPVVDFSGIKFKNFDCYLCTKNLSTKYNTNKIRISCQNFLDVYGNIFLFDVIENAKSGNCRISYPSPVYNGVSICSPLDNDVVKNCSDTWQQRHFDADINRLCGNDELIFPEVLRWSDGSSFKNMFCSMCNPVDDSSTVILTCNDDCQQLNEPCTALPVVLDLHPFRNTFCLACDSSMWCNINNAMKRKDLIEYNEWDLNSVKCFIEPWMCQCNGPGCALPLDIPGVKIRNLFRVNDNKNIFLKTRECEENQIYDEIKNYCRDVTCFPGKVLKGNDCTPLFPTTSKLRYAVDFLIEGKMTNISYEKEILNTIHLYMPSFINEFTGHQIQVLISRYTLLTDIYCNSTANRTSVSLVVHVDFFVEETIDRLYLELKLLNVVDVNTTIFGQPNDFIVTRMKLRTLESELQNGFYNSCDNSTIYNQAIQLYSKYRKTYITKRIVCRQVVIPDSEIHVKASFGNSGELKVKGCEKTFIPEIVWIDNTNKVRVCLDDFLPCMRKPEYIKSLTELALEILTIVCTCVSMVCLLLTLLTYCCLEELRTLPGKNNICLVISLFFSQACLQFGTLWFDKLLFCTAIGVVLHIFWLSTFCFMSVCSFHMFSVFFYLKPIGSKSEDCEKLSKYLIYGLGVPVMIVVINLAVNLGVSDGDSIGYGGGKCFIAGYMSQILSFICPIALICLANLVFFSITAYKIWSRPDVRNTRNDKHDFIVYLKLFILTGVTWVGQIVESLFPVSVLSFIVTILTGLQGLFIFISYVCNRRVFHKLRNSTLSQQQFICKISSAKNSASNSSQQPISKFSSSKNSASSLSTGTGVQCESKLDLTHL